MALESSVIFERTRYFTEVYRNALARQVQQLGYTIERRDHGFELAGVSPELLVRFSKRAQQRDAAIAVREAELGRELTRDEIAVLVRENREKKQYEHTPAEVRQRQLAQVSDSELAQLRALRPPGPSRGVTYTITPGEALARAVEHVFERRTVVPLHELTAEVIRQCYGQYSLRDVKETIAHGRGLLHANGQVSTVAALELERALVTRINAGVGACDALGRARNDPATPLSSEQRTAIATISGLDRPGDGVSRQGGHRQDAHTGYGHRRPDRVRPRGRLLRPQHAGRGHSQAGWSRTGAQRPTGRGTGPCRRGHSATAVDRSRPAGRPRRQGCHGGRIRVALHPAIEAAG
jgi:hypothetical protein